MLLNDAHCHFFSSAFFARLGAQAGVTGDDVADAVTRRLGWDPPGPPESLADRWAGELDRHGVARAVLIASLPGDEESVARAVARHPSRFVGAFMVDPTREDAVSRVEATLARPGMRTVCLFPAMHRYALDDRRVAAVVGATAARPGATLFVHCGVLSVGVRKKLGLPSPFELRHGQPLDVQPLAMDFPALPIVIPHFGAGFFREALMVAQACPNVYLDTSSSNGWTALTPGLTLTDVFRATLSVLGPRKLLFGTDSSFFPRGWVAAVRDRQKDLLDSLGVDGADQSRIFGENLAEMYGLE